jgi:hypothetical protein
MALIPLLNGCRLKSKIGITISGEIVMPLILKLAPKAVIVDKEGLRYF